MPIEWSFIASIQKPTVKEEKPVAEDVLPEFSTTLNVEIADRCNSEGFLRNYRQGMIHVVPDVYKSGCDECYLQMLEQLQVKANLVLPLFRQDHLWGLLCIHQ